MGNNRYTAFGAEARYEPGSNCEVLENLLHITNKVDMDQAEYEAFYRVQIHYSTHVLTADTPITSALIRKMHSDWLGGLYPWAGSYRTVNLSKGDFQWPPYGFVASSMEQLEAGLLKKFSPCRAVSFRDAAAQIAEVHAELLLIHPFRDGNGRLSRWIADIMASQAGFAPPEYRFSGVDAERVKEAYINSVIRGYQMDLEPLTLFFIEALERGKSAGS